ncbi:hypothetical protein [Synechococcus sp. MIT S9508]|uniref:hypothetical protein n=1 Tax=Synechococcus sp. MIT S9508 TaxID=1801629 RepID=UPI0007BBE4A1|nr:hypothetical protein [Synechococcus sp. MIT S9508]KZR87508.1 hypothetical protein MITS9508_02461 [Synechococcus sp. MIT S9508]
MLRRLSVGLLASSALVFNSFPVMAREQCTPRILYERIKLQAESLEKELRKTLGSRPGMQIKNVLWIGEGKFKLICNGQYPDELPFKASNHPPVDRSRIIGWTRGEGLAGKPGKYIFKTSASNELIPILSMYSDELLKYGASIAQPGDVLNTPKKSVLATYIYGADYLEDFVLPENGARIERHPNDHMLTLLSKVDGRESYFVVGKVDSGKLNLAAIRLEPGVTLHVKGNTVHTNDYVTGVVQEIYPKKWGIDEVLLMNDKGDAVRLIPSNR